MRPQVESFIKRVFAAIGLLALYVVMNQLFGDSPVWLWLGRIVLIGLAAQVLVVAGALIYMLVKERRRPR